MMKQNLTKPEIKKVTVLSVKSLFFCNITTQDRIAW